MSSTQRLKSFIESGRSGKLVLICVGNDLRGDDGVGFELFKRLKPIVRHQIPIYNVGNSIENISSLLIKQDATHCLILDAVQFGDDNVPPGTMGFFASTDLDDSQTMLSTHYIPLKVFFDYIKNQSDIKIRILGIKPQILDFGADISVPVLKAVEKLTRFLTAQFKET